jgi:hypothetical protein
MKGLGKPQKRKLMHWDYTVSLVLKPNPKCSIGPTECYA